MPSDLVKNNFTGGEWSPSLYGRTDLQKYGSATRLMKNAFCHPHGGVSNRAGTQFIAELKDSSTTTGRQIPFKFSVTQQYVLLFGDENFRIIKDDGYVVYPVGHPQAGQIVEVTTPYADTELADLKYAQSADVLYLAHPSYEKRKVTRLDHHDWFIQVLSASSSVPTPTGLASSGGASTTTANYVLTATIGGVESLPTSSVNGKVDGQLTWNAQFGVDRFTLYRDEGGSGTYGFLADIDKSKTSFTDNNIAPDFSQGIPEENDPFDNSPQLASISADIMPASWTAAGLMVCNATGWTASSPAYHYAGYLSNIFDDATTSYKEWYNAGSPFDATVEIDYTGGTGEVQVSGFSLEAYRPTPAYEVNAPGSFYFQGYDGASWTTLGSWTGESGWGLGEKRTYTFNNEVEYEKYKLVITHTASGSSTGGKILAHIELFTGTYESAINNPSVVTFFDQRLLWGRTPPNPQSIWGSRIGDFENHNTSNPLRDDDAVEFTLYSTQVNEILWMVPLTDLIILTPNAEWRMSAGSDGASITPTNINIKQQSQYGSAEVEPIVIGNTVLFVQRHGEVVRDLNYSLEADGYRGNDLSVLSDHLMEGNPIVRWAYQKTPHSVIWCVRQDGTMIGLTFLKEHEVWGWHQHETDGEVEDVVSVVGEDQDDVYFIVKRTINGGTKRYVEKLAKRIEDNDYENAWFVDCGLRYDSTPATTITGLSHLEGEDVAVLADGEVVTGMTVSSGQITLPSAASKVLVGLPYTTQIQTMDIEAGGGSGSLQNNVRKTPRVLFRLANTRTLKAGQEFDRLETMVLNSIEHPDPLALFSGDKEISLRAGTFTKGQICIQVDDPLPLTVLSLIIEVDPSE